MITERILHRDLGRHVRTKRRDQPLADEVVNVDFRRRGSGWMVRTDRGGTRGGSPEQGRGSRGGGRRETTGVERGEGGRGRCGRFREETTMAVDVGLVLDKHKRSERDIVEKGLIQV